MGALENLTAFKGQVVVVTGANGQLGSGLCRTFEEAGATVVPTDVAERSASGNPNYLKLDIAKRDEVRAVFDTIAERHQRIDILLNNAGVSVFEPFEERPEESFDWVVDVNLKGTFQCIQSYVRLFDAKGWGSGRIVNIGSLYGVVSPDPRIYTDCARKNSEVYGATKAGIIQMSRYFAVHLAQRKITVNCVSPGGIFNPDQPQGEDFVKNYTTRCPMGRMALVEDMLGGVVYLSSRAAAYVTGQNLVIDGGFTSW